MLIENESDRFCIACGYNLRGLTSEQCPECGLRFDSAGGSGIAWEYRKEMGMVRAFWRTMMDGMFHGKILVNAIAHPVDVRSAIRFRVIISLLVTVPANVLFGIIVHAVGGTGFLTVWQPNGSSWSFTASPFPAWWEIPILWSAGATIWLVLPIGTFITALLWTDILGYWVRRGVCPKNGGKRTVAVSAYVSAPPGFSDCAHGCVWRGLGNVGFR